MTDAYMLICGQTTGEWEFSGAGVLVHVVDADADGPAVGLELFDLVLQLPLLHLA